MPIIETTHNLLLNDNNNNYNNYNNNQMGISNSKSNSLSRIKGPVSVCHCIGDKELFLFGDNHDGDKTSTCVNSTPVTNIIDMILKNNPDKKIDLFVEIMYFNDYIYNAIDGDLREFPNPNNSYIGQVRNHFKDCIFSKNGLCIKTWPNIRFHGIDIRRLLPGKKWYSDTNHKIMSERRVNQNYTDVEEKKIDGYFTDINDYFKVQKQIKFIKNKSIAMLLNKYIYDIFIKENNYFMKLAIIMDHYTLARIMRNFENYESKYIIVYAGDIHIQRFYKFFKHTMAYKTKRRTNLDRCVNVSGLGLPYFK
jgi:hypothetical protein